MSNASLFGRLIARLDQFPTPENSIESEIAKRAHKFRFEADGFRSVTDMAYDYAQQLIEVGLFRLPFPEVVFEITGIEFDGDGKTSLNRTDFGSWTIVAWHVGEDIYFRWHQVASGFVAAAYATMVWGCPAPGGEVRPSGTLDDDPGWGLDWPDLEKGFRAIAAEDAEELDVISGRTTDGKSVDLPRAIWEMGMAPLSVAVALLNLGSGIKLQKVPEPKFINKQRKAKGKAPLYGHTLVTVDYDAIMVPGRRSGGPHASPKVHWRRGHVRTLQNGNKTLVRACLVGAPDGIDASKSKEYLVKPAPKALEHVMDGFG